MPTKYTDRLKLPTDGFSNIKFYTEIGLEIATGYERVVFKNKIPYIEFSESEINKNKIFVPNSQKWRINNNSSPYIEYRSKDCCNIKIILWKKSYQSLQSGKYYISPFKLKSDQFPILIEPLYRKQTLSNQNVF
jgi:hypothetical protein